MSYSRVQSQDLLRRQPRVPTRAQIMAMTSLQLDQEIVLARLLKVDTTKAEDNRRFSVLKNCLPKLGLIGLWRGVVLDVGPSSMGLSLLNRRTVRLCRK